MVKFVTTTSFPSETRSIKTENRLLWIAVAVLGLFLIYSEARYERLKSSITSKAAYNAYKEQTNVRR